MTSQFVSLWRERLAETDINQVRAQVAEVNPFTSRDYLAAGEYVIAEYEKQQIDAKLAAQNEREEKVLEIARIAEQRAQKATQQSVIAIVVSIFVLIGTIIEWKS